MKRSVYLTKSAGATPPRRGSDALPYTDKEMAIYRLIVQAGGAVTTNDVVDAFYRGQRRPPKHARIIVGGILNSLRHNFDHNGHPCALAKSERRGPHPIAWKLVPRILPRAPTTLPTAPATPPAPPVVMGARERLTAIVAEIGLDATLGLLAAVEIAVAA